MEYGFLANWNDFLPRDDGHLLAIAGAGDRNTVLNSLTEYYQGLGLSVNLTQASNRTSDSATAAGNGEPTSASVTLCEVEENVPFSLKLPLAHGLSWPMDTTLALVVLGGEGVGTQACAALHGLGQQGVGPASLAEMVPHELMVWEHLTELLCGEGGYLHHIPQDVPVVLVISGLEEIADSIGLFGFLGEVMKHPRLPLVLFCSQGEDGPSLRTAYRYEEEGTAK